MVSIKIPAVETPSSSLARFHSVSEIVKTRSLQRVIARTRKGM
jgi:hypothetical protein